ncbi:hypothetical protein, partial [Caballeronia glathei]|uniref:hypothetical protein n=1 Tax=Caballeronia glathei TaxID=60547 RepID=UPI0019D3451E
IRRTGARSARFPSLYDNAAIFTCNCLHIGYFSHYELALQRQYVMGKMWTQSRLGLTQFCCIACNVTGSEVSRRRRIRHENMFSDANMKKIFK